MSQKRYRSWIKLRMTDDEYMDLNAIMECAGIDIDNGREMAKYFLKLAGAKVETD